LGWRVLDEESLSDHFYIVFDIHLGPASSNTNKQKLPKINLKTLESALVSDKFNRIANLTHAEESALALTETIQKCHIVAPTGSRSRRSVHWWTPEIGTLRKTANHMRRVFQRKRKRAGQRNCTTEEENARTAKRNLVTAIKRAKEDAWRKLCDLVELDTWGLPYKLVMGKLTRPPPIPELNTPGRIEHIVKGLFPQHPTRDTTSWRSKPMLDGTQWKIDLPELKVAASRLKSEIAPGTDGIPNEVVRVIVALNPGVLLNVYNNCLAEGTFPRTWKKARLVLLRKGNKPLGEPSSYRPLCLLDCLGKLLEKILDNRLRSFLDDTGGLDERQFGFRKGRSTIDALNTLSSSIKSSTQKIGLLTMDIKNAFNSAPWNAIMMAVYEMDVPEYLQRMVSSYLENRRLLIEMVGEDNIEIDVTCGVPQGSVLGPTLWNILYDGLLRTRLPINVKFLAYADDVALVAEARDTIQLEQLLTVAAQRVNGWLTEKGLKLALHKCETMVVTKTRTHNDMRIIIDGHLVQTCQSLKYLGIQLDSKWSFSDHAKIVSAKAGKVVQNLSRIMPNISTAKSRKRKLLSNVVHSILMYGAPVWSQDMSKMGWTSLLKTQRRICLRVTSAYCTVSGDAVRVISGIAPLDLMAIERKTSWN